MLDSVKGSPEIILCMKTWNLRKKRKNCTCVAFVCKIIPIFKINREENILHKPKEDIDVWTLQKRKSNYFAN